MVHARVHHCASLTQRRKAAGLHSAAALGIVEVEPENSRGGPCQGMAPQL